MQLTPFRATYPLLDEVESPKDFFSNVKQDYRKYYASGLFGRFGRPGLYIYSIRKASHVYTGVMGGVAVEDFLEGRIRKHEHTIAEKEAKQLQLLKSRQAAVKPVLLAHEPVPELQAWLERYTQACQPVLAVPFEDKEEEHLIWAVEEPEHIHWLQGIFRQQVPVSYIADGHHRTFTAVEMYQRMKNGEEKEVYSSFFAAFFPFQHIEIFDFNRVVSSLNGHSPATFVAHLSHWFEVAVLQAPSRPSRKFEVTMLLQGQWYLLRWKERVLLEYADKEVLLDAMLLNHKIMAGLLGIEDVRNDKRIYYVEGPKGVKGVAKQVEKHEEAVAFCLYPVQMQEVMKIADLGKVLPPKSTWFEPRMKNGLLVQAYH
ncbi:DUF1015 family protein [Phaeodactylibacter luteus]|uniref:DUF1015 domain-containing protein n=1 Tax=Phaeodactylibacter luteus TaxID=1564516 RepID=A0A5C6RZX8_9BACT|nr:DUF1015 family protein [Phaeodactylibacter luteus]TXB67667.1 DUF1015 domain-containing protein [Phaeodactylibacter luteus]